MIALRLSAGDRERAEAAAAKEQTSVNGLARRLVEEGVARVLGDAGAPASHGAAPPSPAYQVVYDEDGQ